MNLPAIIRRRRSGVSPLAIYAVLGIRPELVLDFDDEKYFANSSRTTFSNAITHTRASAATYVDANGILQTAGVNVPRVGHHVWNGSAWVNEGLLHESEARTNNFLWSEDFTQVDWIKSGVTVTANAIAAPDGNTTADRIEKTTTDTTTPGQAISATAGQTWVWSAFVKDDTSSGWLRLRSDNGGSVVNVFVNYKTGVVGTGGLVAGVQDFGNGWKRVYAVRSTPNAAATSFSICPVDADAGVDATGQIVFIWGAQVEQGATPSSYIPTSGSTVTRAADVLTVPSANLPWPEPVVIGSELVTNGTFDSDTAWTKGSQWTITGGKAVSTPSSATGDDLIIRQDNNLVETGKVYAVTYTVSDRTVGAVAMFVRGSSPAVYHSTNDTFTRYVVAGSGGRDIEFLANQSFDGSLDNISVREINSLAVSIQMQGRMTYADNNTTEVTFVRWRADALNFIINNMNSSTGSGQSAFYQAAAGTTDFVITGSSYYTPGINVPYNIASRHGSTFINGAVDGTALTANTTPTALPDLSATDLNLGFDYMGTISMLRIWADDLGDTGIAEASS